MSQKRFIQTLKGEQTDRAPFWFMRQAGRYLPEYREVRASTKGFLDLCFTPAKAEEVTLQPLRRFGFDAAILFSDILVIPYALGQPLSFKEGEGPVLEKTPLSQLRLDGMLEKLSPVFETIDRLTKSLPKGTALIGFSGSPWTLACYMLQGKGGGEFPAARQMMYQQPAEFAQLMDVLVEAITAYISRQVEAGAEVIQLFDSWAGILTPPAFAKWVIEPTRRIVVDFKKKHPAIPVIGFPRMAGMQYQTYAEQTQVNGVSVDFTLPMEWAKQQLQPKVTVQGNLDPLLLASNKEAAIEEVKRLRHLMGTQRFIFNLGHGIVPQTPPEHVAAVCEVLRS